MKAGPTPVFLKEGLGPSFTTLLGNVWEQCFGTESNKEVRSWSIQIIRRVQSLKLKLEIVP